MLRVNELRLPVSHTQEELLLKIREKLRLRGEEELSVTVLRRSLDARKKPALFFSYVVLISTSKRTEERVLRKKVPGVLAYTQRPYHFPYVAPLKEEEGERPAVIGFGPAGMFAALVLAEAGLRPVIYERGASLAERDRDVEAFWRDGILKPNSNVQFGEGGAGAYSDGKLNTLIKDRDGKHRYVLETLCRFGAPEEILYDYKPHIGTDRLKEVVRRLREHILLCGGEIRFHTAVTDFQIKNGTLSALVLNGTEEVPCKCAILAIGHSARDTIKVLCERHVPMEAKPFAVGFRVEHPAEVINRSQYGSAQAAAVLGAANYKLTHHCLSGRGVYTFCMCPGGMIVNASSEAGHLAVNGMSNYARDGKKSNSAVIVTVTPTDFGVSEDPLSGIFFQRSLEQAAFRAGCGAVPVESYGEYRAGELSLNETELAALSPDICGTWRHGPLHTVLPKELRTDLIEGIEAFGKQITGFNDSRVILAGVESRTSSPVRILRNERCEAALRGIFPCGEGAGYAGGIMSAAIDGLTVAEAAAANR